MCSPEADLDMIISEKVAYLGLARNTVRQEGTAVSKEGITKGAATLDDQRLDTQQTLGNGLKHTSQSHHRRGK